MDMLKLKVLEDDAFQIYTVFHFCSPDSSSSILTNPPGFCKFIKSFFSLGVFRDLALSNQIKIVALIASPS